MASSSSSSISGSGMQPRQRSISLPSRLTNLTSLPIEEDLINKLKSHDSSSNPLGLDLIQSKLLDLADLYISSETYLTQTTSTQQTLIAYDQEKLVKDALARSDRFLTILSTATELISSMKDQLRDLQSAIRRRGGCSNYITSYINTYISYRKKSKKEISRALHEIKQMELELPMISFEIVDPVLAVVLRVMREVALATTAILKSLFVSLSLPASMKAKGWSVLISKLKLGNGNGNKGSSQFELFNEVSGVDITLSSTRMDEMEIVQGRLRVLDDGVSGIEGAVDRVYRLVIQSRVTFLNMLVQ